MNETLFSSAAALARAIEAGDVSSRELVEACLERIAAVNPRLNAVVQIAGEAALEKGARCDRERASRTVRGPLHGVPVTIKDSFDTAGIVTTAGTAGRAGKAPERDATAVARLRAAGAIVLGKTNTPELTLAGETVNHVYGRTENPYDLERTPAGSSGGAAAILAAGGSFLDVGSDTGGSIRMPAHFCGIAGMKPTAGRVPRTGHAIDFRMGAIDALTHVGPMARHVEDLELVFPLLAGPDGTDPAIVPMPHGDPAAVEIAALHVAFFTDNGVAPPAPETEAAVRAAAAALAERGARVTEERPEPVPRANDLWNRLMTADGGARVRKLLTAAGTAEPHPTLRWMLARPALGAEEMGDLLDEWVEFRSAMLGFLERHDVVLCPVAATPAVPHRGTDARTYSYTKPFNLTGWPVVVMRVGTSPEGLPIGVQVAARPWREDVALAVARALEETFGGFRPPAL